MFRPAFLNSAAAAGAAATPAATAFSMVGRPGRARSGAPLQPQPLRPAARLPVLRRRPRPASLALLQYVGAPLMLGALLWEAVADYQQQKDKEAQAVAGTKK